MSRKTERALICVDWRGVPLVVATDGPTVSYMVDVVSSSAEECGIVATEDCPAPGLYLWSGASRVETNNAPDCCYEPETVFDGVVRPVRADEILRRREAFGGGDA